MWSRVAVLCMASACAAGFAEAGAWLREDGSGFVAASATLRANDPDAENGIYADCGLAPRLTVGIDLNDQAGQSGHALIFARLPLADPDGRSRLSAQLGLGAHHLNRQVAPMVRASLLWGRGMGSDGSGWFAIDATIEHRAGQGTPIWKIDSVLGLPGEGRVRSMLKLETAYKSGFGPSVTATPSLIFRDQRGRRWVTGFELRSAGWRRSAGLTLGLWQEF